MSSAPASLNVSNNEVLSETLKDYRRCHNIHITGIPEGATGVPGPIKFFQSWLPSSFGCRLNEVTLQQRSR